MPRSKNFLWAGRAKSGSMFLSFQRKRFHRHVLYAFALLAMSCVLKTNFTSAFIHSMAQYMKPNESRLALQAARQIGEKLDLKLLLIDHYDSFTYNLVDMLGQHCVHPPIVIAADSSAKDVQKILDQGRVDGIVLSPGPGNPDTCGPLAASLVETHPDTPVLGVCLGHQILGTLYGGTCTRSPEPVHGQVHSLDFAPGVSDDALWQGAFDILSTGVNGDSEPWQVTRYHSLHVTNLQETPLIPTAMTTDHQIVMAFRHPTLPHFGVQFHPESIGSNHGWALLRSFCGICHNTKKHSRHTLLPPSHRGFQQMNEMPDAVKSIDAAENQFADPQTTKTQVIVHKVPHSLMKPSDVMKELLDDVDYRFWLDTSDKRTNAISVLGEASERIEYWGQDAPLERRGVYVYRNKESDEIKHYDCDILTYLEQKYTNLTNTLHFVDLDGDELIETNAASESPDILPFSYRGGHVGYLGYEVRHDTSEYLARLEGGRLPPRKINSSLAHSSTPTAALMAAERSYVYDHGDNQWYLVLNTESNNSEQSREGLEWIKRQSRKIQIFSPSSHEGHFDNVSKNTKGSCKPVNFSPSRSKQTYNRNFEECLEQIRQGESYELCLTNKLEAFVITKATPFDLYSILRRQNPAPFSSFFDWNSGQRTPVGSSFAVCCSSPERFVSVQPRRDGSMLVEAKPIKGTCARVVPQQGQPRLTRAEEQQDKQRAEELRSSVKNRAENLMIVDLLRNDLSRVCQNGSVHVSNLMDIESFATVHQMVSTIRGTLNTPENSAISTLRACFPGGSMTGAPKLRTMEILDELEQGEPRGAYSGCLGYISANGSMDMNIVIRTAVVTPFPQVGSWKVSVGAGGAITILSESEDEYDEMILKASAVMSAVGDWAAGESGLDIGRVTRTWAATNEPEKSRRRKV